MIITNENHLETHPIATNIGRPNIIPQPTKDPDGPRTKHSYAPNVDQWRNFHDWIHECDIEIIVNGAFPMIEELISRDGEHGYFGGGFAYTFWFKTEEDKDVFLEKLEEMVPDR